MSPAERGEIESKLAAVRKILDDSLESTLEAAGLPKEWKDGNAGNGKRTTAATYQAQRKAVAAYRKANAGLIAERAGLEERLHPRAAEREIVSRWPETVAVRKAIEDGRKALAAGADPMTLPPAVDDPALLPPRNPDFTPHTLPPHDPPGTIPEPQR